MSNGAYREDHPLPAIVMHWVHLVCVVLLAFTGFFIDWPFRFFGMTMATAHWIHYVCMYIVLIALAARVYWAFYGTGSSIDRDTHAVDRDYHNFAPQHANRGQLLPTVKYYLFLRPTHPRTAKYNSLQKGTYVFWAVLLLVQAYTGFAIYGPTYLWPIFRIGTALVGGLMTMRMIHYFIMWVFIVTALVHIYLSAAEDAEALPLMFWWRETKPAEEAE